MRRVQEFDELFRESCDPGKLLVFAIHIAARPSHRVLIRSMGASGLGIVGKAFAYLKENGARNIVGVGDGVSTGKIRFLFLGVTNSGGLTEYRRKWYRHYSQLAEICWGRGQYEHVDYLKLLNDKRIQFQFSFDLNNLEIVENNATQSFFDILENEHYLRGALESATRDNWPANRS